MRAAGSSLSMCSSTARPTAAKSTCRPGAGSSSATRRPACRRSAATCATSWAPPCPAATSPKAWRSCCSSSPRIWPRPDTMLVRARPWLGALVEIRVEAKSPAQARAALEAGFAAIEAVHRRLSFHETASELSQLNRSAREQAVTASPILADVLRKALHLAQITAGVFDPSVGGALVGAGLLPAPGDTVDVGATWRDVHIADADRVRFDTPL